MQAAGSDLLLPWSNGEWVSTDQGSTWQPVRAGSVQSATFVQASMSDVQVVDSAHATMATLPLPQGLSPSGLSAGLLPGSRVWVSSGSDFDVPPDLGHTGTRLAWTQMALPTGESEIGVRHNSSGGVSVLTGRLDPTLTLVRHVMTLTSRSTALQGPGVSPGCTAMLDDGSLLAISQADGLPYRLAAGNDTFVRDLAGPSGPLGCLEPVGRQPALGDRTRQPALGQPRRQDLAGGSPAPGQGEVTTGGTVTGRRIKSPLRRAETALDD